MKHLVTLLLLVFFFENTTLAQSALVEVADLSVKVPGMGSKEYYYGFEAGDELVFDFVDLSKKGLKQVEIIEYPNQTNMRAYRYLPLLKASKSINEEFIYSGLPITLLRKELVLLKLIVNPPAPAQLTLIPK
ncbi:hypothetical protein [Adhaeribacter pallidiroseus]|uniref:Uncharacterized protein n=1 Tax=Adhaeribacter pallidiroseus TaxID=2072847 RepID=A0A369Q1H3_9BACT|nr:hypothetical protein [Adhaeribacter pallidiroseus]RDC58733.1 hypothetical protein AHMF7616_05367 [Adhaeribacter pallidiroseus]